MIGRGVLPHVALLALAVTGSAFVWTRDKTPPGAASEVTVWNARPADVERIVFETKGRKVSLEGRNDAAGHWFYGTFQAPASTAADGGAVPPHVATFVSVTQGNHLAEAYAPLRALREVGRIGDDRAVEFGLKEPEGTLSITIAGKAHALTLGAVTAEGINRYVRDDATGIVYVVKDATRDLASGDNTAAEHETHEFKDADIESVHVVAQGKSRDVLRRGPANKRIWADPSDPDKVDETAANWLAKIERLRPVEYLEAPPAGLGVIARIEYRGRNVRGAFLEIGRAPHPAPSDANANQAPKPQYVVRSERTRLWATVFEPVGEQVEQDLASVVK